MDKVVRYMSWRERVDGKLDREIETYNERHEEALYHFSQSLPPKAEMILQANGNRPHKMRLKTDICLHLEALFLGPGQTIPKGALWRR